jgi:hypothetical protein
MRILLLAALLFPSAAMAQTAPPAPAPPAKQDAPIVVTGTRTTDEEIADFVDAFTVAPPMGQLARFELEVCPIASGMAEEQKTAIANRLRAVAKAAGVRVGKPECRPNILVIVTRDKHALIELLKRRRPAFFGDLTRSEIRALTDSTEPAVAWHIKGPLLNADGQEMDYDADGGFYVNQTTNPGSRISFASRPQFAAAIVMIESRALEGLTTIQLADYAAMRTLIRTDPTRLGKSAAPTILKILAAPPGTPVPLTLTEWDLGVLRGFYASDPNLTAAAQRSAVRKGVKKAVGAPGN